MARKPTKFQISEELNKSMLTSIFRVSYAHILEPWTGDEAKEPRYSLQAIFDKDDEFIANAKKVVAKIAKEAFGPNAVQLMKVGKLKNPFRDGDLEFPDDETYQGKIFFNANGARASKKPPPLVDQKRRDMRDNPRVYPHPEEVFYSGVYARAEVKFYPYDEAGGKGIACYLFSVQYARTGEPLSGGRPIDQVYDELPEEELKGKISGEDDFLDDDDDDIPF